ncbi:hypothetical protein [Halorientalis pallida]|uniref:Uncharacterized protein n=1 Tax=Halorientalis pallida TaxID=2479928 RepID=A0A498KXS8_9EURY|nr:hypothetical protein [Halorientalis pallida]RXK50048.1 hypothetical protein EAF64_05640 [Halorientalis pallida]
MSQDRRIHDRRTVLGSGLTTGTLLLAGCLGDGGGDDSGNAEDPTATTDDPVTATETVDATPGEPTAEETPAQASDTQPSDRGFHDDFEDGDYTSDPRWNAPPGEQGAGSIDVACRRTPGGGQHVLRMRSEGPPTAIGFAEGTQGWDGPWVADGLVDTGQVSGGRGRVGILVGVSTTDESIMPEFSLAMRGNVAFNVEGETTRVSAPRLESDRWYRLEIRHDGAGTITGTRWPAGERPANGSSVSIDGLSPGSGGTLSLQLIGQHGADAEAVVDHAFVRWRPE